MLTVHACRHISLLHDKRISQSRFCIRHNGTSHSQFHCLLITVLCVHTCKAIANSHLTVEADFSFVSHTFLIKQSCVPIPLVIPVSISWNHFFHKCFTETPLNQRHRRPNLPTNTQDIIKIISPPLMQSSVSSTCPSLSSYRFSISTPDKHSLQQYSNPISD